MAFLGSSQKGENTAEAENKALPQMSQSKGHWKKEWSLSMDEMVGYSALLLLFAFWLYLIVIWPMIFLLFGFMVECQKKKNGFLKIERPLKIIVKKY